MLFVDWSGCVIAVKWENARNRLGPGSSTDSTSTHSWEKNMQNNVGKKRLISRNSAACVNGNSRSYVIHRINVHCCYLVYLGNACYVENEVILKLHFQ